MGSRFVLVACLLFTSGAAGEGIVLWEFDTSALGATGTVAWTSSGTLLLSAGGDAREYTPTYPTGATLLWRQDDGLGVNSARRIPNGNTLMAEDANHLVVERTSEDESTSVTVWQFGVNNVAACDATHLSNPADVSQTANGDRLIADRGNNRVLRIRAGAVIWSYGRADCAAETTPDGMNAPASAVETSTGNILVTVPANHRVLEIEPTGAVGGNVVASYGTGTPGSGPLQLNDPRSAEEINGQWLISDGANARVLLLLPEVTGAPGSADITWQYGVTGVESSAPGFLGKPKGAVRTARGSIVISDGHNNRYLEVAPAMLRFQPQPAVQPGTCSPPLTVEVYEESTNTVRVAPRDVDISWFPESGLEAFSDPDCTIPLVTQVFPGGASTGEVYVRAPAPGSYKFVAQPVGYGKAEVHVSVDAPTGTAPTPASNSSDEPGSLGSGPGSFGVGAACSASGSSATLLPLAILSMLFFRRRSVP